MIVRLEGVDWEGHAASFQIELEQASPSCVALTLHAKGRVRRVELALDSYAFDCLRFDLLPGFSALSRGSENLMALVRDSEGRDTTIQGDVYLSVHIDSWSLFLFLKPSADPDHPIGLSQLNGRSRFWDLFFSREAVSAFVEACSSLIAEVDRIEASRRDPRDRCLGFPDDPSGYGVTLGQYDHAAYAYLSYQRERVASVWLYNLDPLPDRPPPTEFDESSPPLPAKWIYSRKIEPVACDEDAHIVWDPVKPGHATLFLHGERIAELHRDDPVGRSILVKKDNPHAKRLGRDD